MSEATTRASGVAMIDDQPEPQEAGRLEREDLGRDAGRDRTAGAGSSGDTPGRDHEHDADREQDPTLRYVPPGQQARDRAVEVDDRAPARSRAVTAGRHRASARPAICQAVRQQDDDEQQAQDPDVDAVGRPRPERRAEEHADRDRSGDVRVDARRGAGR